LLCLGRFVRQLRTKIPAYDQTAKAALTAAMMAC